MAITGAQPSVAANAWVELVKTGTAERHQVYRFKDETAAILEVRHLAGKYWALGQRGTIFRSEDFERWERIELGSNHTLLHILEGADGTLLVRGTGTPVDHFISRDGGDSWKPIHQAQQRGEGFVHPDRLRSTDRIWVEDGRFRMATVSPRGILESTDGTDWRSIDVEAPGIEKFSNSFRRRIGDVDYLVLLNNSVFSSQDGAAWHREPMDAFTSSGMWLENFRGRHVFAVSWNGTNPRAVIHVRTPHEPWSPHEPFGKSGLQALVEDNGYLWALTSTEGRTHNTVWRSADALTWEPVVEDLRRLAVRLGTSPKGVMVGGLSGEIYLFPRGEPGRTAVVPDRFAELNRAPDAPAARPLASSEAGIKQAVQQIEAADRGDAKSREALIAALLEGNGFYRNPAQAEFMISHWELPADRYAYSLAMSAERSNPPDRVSARRYFLQAANAGNRDAALRFGIYAQRGFGGDVDTKLALHWLRQVVQHGTESQKAEARKRVGFLEDVVKADAGDLDAGVRVGREFTLEESDLVDADWATARRYLRAALAAGNVEAGRIMLMRPETPEDRREIQMRMAGLGDTSAMETVAMHLLQGNSGFQKNPALAGTYYLELAKGGHNHSKLLVALVMLGFVNNEMEFAIDPELGRKYLEETASENFGQAPRYWGTFKLREARGEKMPVDGEVSDMSTAVFDLLKEWDQAKKTALAEADVIALFRATWRDADYSRAEENLAAELRAAKGTPITIRAMGGRELRLDPAPGIPGGLQPLFDKLFPDDWQVGEFPDGASWLDATGSPGFIVYAARIHTTLAVHYQHVIAQMAMAEARKPGWVPLETFLKAWRDRLAHLDEPAATELRELVSRAMHDVRAALQQGGKPEMNAFPAW